MTTNNAANQSSVGVQSLTSAGAFNGRTITGTSNQISISNGDGTAGNPTLALTSTIYVSGISFDSGSNTLSSYIEGTYSPTVTNTGSAPTVTYTQQVGRYTRTGNRVVCNGVINLATYTAGTGDTQVSAFPITSNNTANNNSLCAVSLASVTAGASVLWYTLVLPPNATSADISGIRSATTTLNLVAAGPSGSTNINYTMVYEV